MWFKFIGSILILLAGTLLGFNMAARYTERPRQIRQLIACLASLKAYISYAAIPLPEAMSACTSGARGAVLELFQTTAAILLDRGWLSPKEALEEALSKTPDLVFERPELELIELLGANLGVIDRIEQEKYLSMIQEQLRQLETEAARCSAQNSKMYRYLGVCGSLAIVILLA